MSLLRSQIAAMRAQLDAIEETVIAMEAVQIQATSCQHPNKTNISTMTNPNQWYCPDCKQTSGSEITT
jgi:transposase-like protein